MMKKIIYTIFLLSIIFLLIFQYSRNINDEINYEKFNIVAPGVIRTPDVYFKNLDGYNFKPNYMVINDVRIHYLDEGPKDGEIIYLLHGEPTWSYLFRKMIPVFTDAGHRVIVPDMIGFGKSDKFESKHDYSYKHHVDVMKELVERLDLKNATHFGQDWGGLVGLRVVAEMPDRFAQVIVSNTGMVAGEGIRAWLTQRMMELTVWWNGPITFEELKTAAQGALNSDNPSSSDGISMFTKWIGYSYYSKDMDIVGIIENFGRLNLSEGEKKAYEAPYPSGRYKAGAHVWPYLIPTQLQENEKYWKEVYEEWDKPFLVAFGGEERITIRMKDDFVNRIPNPTIITLGGAGHFVQEEVGPELAQIIIDFIEGKKVTDLIE